MKVQRIIQLLVSVFEIGVIGIALADIKSGFEEFKIVPDVIDTAPLQELHITYQGQKLSLGGEFTPTLTKDFPDVSYEYEEGAYYTLLFLDPDTATESGSEVRHWLIGNIPENKVNEGQLFTEYLGPAPPLNTGKHRYTFLLFKQNGRIEFDEPYVKRLDLNRFEFWTRKLAEKYNLGQPVAGNILMAEWDDYVTIVHTNMGFVYP